MGCRRPFLFACPRNENPEVFVFEFHDEFAIRRDAKARRPTILRLGGNRPARGIHAW